jgi:hypothetical protein
VRAATIFKEQGISAFYLSNHCTAAIDIGASLSLTYTVNRYIAPQIGATGTSDAACLFVRVQTSERVAMDPTVRVGRVIVESHDMRAGSASHSFGTADEESSQDTVRG